MLEIAVCDDNRTELEIIRTMLYKHCKEIHMQAIVSIFDNGYDLIKTSKKFHAIFLDIKMDGLDGIQVAKEIRNKDKRVRIIYVTNYSTYRPEAFTVRAFGYIVKPILYNQICDQLDDVIDYTNQESNKLSYTFNTDKGFRTIELQMIYYFESNGHKVRIHCKDEFYIISESIMNIFNHFKVYGFSMPHKSYIINLKHVSSIKGYELELTDGAIVPISQKRAVEFKEEFHSYLRDNFNTLMRR